MRIGVEEPGIPDQRVYAEEGEIAPVEETVIGIILERFTQIMGITMFRAASASNPSSGSSKVPIS